MRSAELKAAILRILKGEELSGYSVYKVLGMKGMETWPNHVYTTLIEMEEKDGWLKSRWVGEGRNPRSRHLYSLSASGKARYDDIVRSSLYVLMESFFLENLHFEDISFHMTLVREALGERAGWSKQDRFRLVIASPSYHPLVCFPKFYYAVSGAYPNASVYVVKNPWQNTKPLEGRKNLTFLEGSRDEIPLRDGFADYLLIEGFPSTSSITETISECMRVLGDDGCLLVEIPSILTLERREPHTTVFPEYVLRLFYDLCGEDRTVRIEDVHRVLSTCFNQVKQVEVRGKVIFLAVGKRRVPKTSKANGSRHEDSRARQRPTSGESDERLKIAIS